MLTNQWAEQLQTAQRIEISNFYQSKTAMDILAKFEPVELRDDLRQESFLVLLQMPAEKFNGIVAANGLKFYFVRVLLNMAKSNTSGFYRKFRLQNAGLDRDVVDSGADIAPQDYTHLLGRLTWYERELFRLYMEHFDCNCKKLSAYTLIPYSSVVQDILSIKKHLRKLIKKECST